METRRLNDTTGEYLIPLEAVNRILEVLEQDPPDYSPTLTVTEGMVLRALRFSVHMQQREVERLAKLPLNYLSRLENKEHGVMMSVVLAILEAMNMDLTDYDRKYKELLNQNYEVH